MFNLGPFELVAIFVVALLVFGPDKLPEMGRQVGKAVREFKKFQASMEGSVREVIDPITGPIINNGPVGPPPTNVRDGGTVSTGGGTASNGETAANTGPNIPRSATIQDPEPADAEEAAAPGSFGHYAPTEQPAASDTGPAPAAEPAPPEPPADADPR